MRLLLLAFLGLLFTNIAAQNVVSSIKDSTVIISNIIVSGNKHTKTNIILREIFFKEGDKFRLNIINNNNQKRLYYTILDIQPDNVVNVLIPDEKSQPEDFLISPEDTITLQNIFTINPPYGFEVLKVIASDVPLDLRNIFAKRSKSVDAKGKPKNPFEIILEGMYKTDGYKKRGREDESIQPDAVNITTYPFHIIKK